MALAERGGDPVTRAGPALIEVPEPQARLTDGLARDGVGNRERVPGARGQAFVLPLDVRAGVALVAASGDGGDQRDQRVARDRPDQADVLVTERPQHDRRVGEDGHLAWQHADHPPARPRDPYP